MKQNAIFGFLVVVIEFLAGAAWGLEPRNARHLLERTGFGGSIVELRALAPLTREQAVTRVLETTLKAAPVALPEWSDDPLLVPNRMAMLDEQARRERLRQMRQEARDLAMELRGWWLREMATTDAPLGEKMTLFWHNHFTSSLQKVKAPQLMARQNALLRSQALGNFGALLHAIVLDPAMMVYLDTQTNRARKPNENFARELLELFTLGEGHYSERDIKEAARAFTGIALNRREGTVALRRRQHDNGTKNFMGRSGNFGPREIVEILLQQQRVAEHITEKLWREFISPQPDPAEVRRLAGVFRQNHYELRPLLQALLTCDAFWAEQNRGTLVKSPVELVVGTVRTFEIPVGEGRLMAVATRQLGQDLFAPPNVKGWPGGTTWINSTTLLARRQLIERLMRGAEMANRRARIRRGEGGMFTGNMARTGQMNFQAWQQIYDQEHGAEKIEQMLLVLPATESAHDFDELGETLEQLLLDPVYQVK